MKVQILPALQDNYMYLVRIFLFLSHFLLIITFITYINILNY